MIQFDRGEDRFSLRVAGVALHRGRVLLHKSVDDDFWCLPGGRAELRETASATLRREMLEELDVQVQIERLLFVVENFFPHDECRYHELGLYFRVQLPGDWKHLDATASFEGQEGDSVVEFRWFPLEGLDEVVLYPEFLRTDLAALPRVTTHIVEVDSALADRVEA
jgi:ADP-ribose pyrophosphatase YjhB (NUDIX family)